MTFRPRFLASTVALIAIGVAWRTLPLHLPFVLFKYGGSALWAAMLYTLLAAFVLRPAAPALLLTCTVEFFKLYHRPALDAFRLTLPGKLLLGRVFSFADLLVYAASIALLQYLCNKRHNLSPQNPSRPVPLS